MAQLRNQREIKYIETNKNESTTVPNPWNAAKAILTQKTTKIQHYIKVKEKSKGKT